MKVFKRVIQLYAYIPEHLQNIRFNSITVMVMMNELFIGRLTHYIKNLH